MDTHACDHMQYDQLDCFATYEQALGNTHINSCSTPTLLRLYGSPNKVDVLFQSASVYSLPFTGGSVNLPLLTAAACT